MAAPSPEPPIGRPTIHINCAVSVDGRLAYAGGKQARLSGPDDLRRVQELRSASDGILVGVGTVVADDPSLRVHWELLDRPPGTSPVRVILDSNGRTPPGARVLDGQQPTLIATAEKCTRDFPPTVSVVRVGMHRVDLRALLPELGRRGIRRLMVEGGSQVIGSFLALGVVDRMTVFVAPVVIGDATAPVLATFPMGGEPTPVVPLRRVETRPLDEGTLMTYVPANAPA
ncbi:MAG: dihydrofolate reductase family protein [Thermoplasmata archaeon]|nr:dihydrofolate reductase family protein [Thermoplasmata archaeon]